VSESEPRLPDETSAIPGSDESATSTERDVIRGDREAPEMPEDEVIGEPRETSERDVMGEPGKAALDVMGAPLPETDEMIGDDPDRVQP
jgi:hypothetical protein